MTFIGKEKQLGIRSDICVNTGKYERGKERLGPYIRTQQNHAVIALEAYYQSHGIEIKLAPDTSQDM